MRNEALPYKTSGRFTSKVRLEKRPRAIDRRA